MNDEVLVSLIGVVLHRGGTIRVPLRVYTDMDKLAYSLVTAYDKAKKEVVFTVHSNQQIN